MFDFNIDPMDLNGDGVVTDAEFLAFLDEEDYINKCGEYEHLAFEDEDKEEEEYLDLLELAGFDPYEINDYEEFRDIIEKLALDPDDIEDLKRVHEYMIEHDVDVDSLDQLPDMEGIYELGKEKRAIFYKKNGFKVEKIKHVFAFDGAIIRMKYDPDNEEDLKIVLRRMNELNLAEDHIEDLRWCFERFYKAGFSRVDLDRVDDLGVLFYHLRNKGYDLFNDADLKKLYNLLQDCNQSLKDTLVNDGIFNSNI